MARKTKDRITFTQDPATGVMILTAPNGETSTIQTGVFKAQEASTEDVPMSAARRKLLELNRPTLSKTESFDFKGDWWHIRRLNFSQKTVFAMFTQRDKDGNLVLTSDTLTSLAASMLFAAVAEDTAGEKDFFGSISEAWDWVDSPDEEISELVNFLFEKVNEVNPHLVREGERQLTAEAEKKTVNSPTSETAGVLLNQEYTMQPTT